MFVTISFDGRYFSVMERKHGNATIPKDDIKNVEIRERYRKYKPDIFFMVYVLFSVLFGSLIIYFVMKAFERNYILYGIAAYVGFAMFSIYSIIRTANKKDSLFIRLKNGNVLEFPINDRVKEKEIVKFFSLSGISVSYRQG